MNITVVENDPVALHDLLCKLRPFAVSHGIWGFRDAGQLPACGGTSSIDLLIIGISTSDIGGFELIRQLRRGNEGPTTIVVGEYGDFEHVRTSLRLGVVDYLTKPPSADELREAVEVALSSAGARRGAREARLAWSLLSKPLARADHHNRESWGVILIVCENWEAPITWRASGVDEDFIRQALAPARTDSYLIADLDEHRRVIMVPPEDASLAQIEVQALQVHHAVQRAGVVVHTAYDLAAQGEEPRLVLGRVLRRLADQMRLECSTFVQAGQAGTIPEAATERLHRLTQALARQRMRESAPAALAELHAILHDLHRARVTQPAIVQTLDGFFGLIRKHMQGGDERHLPERQEIEAAVHTCRTYADLAAWVEAQLRQFLEPRRPATPSDLVGQLVNTIRTSYWEDVSLQAFAAEHGVSVAYFSRLFKDLMGVAFRDYVTQVRVAKAKELLARPDLQLQDISVLVGYRDPKYLGRLFHRVVGLSPAQYQRMQQPTGSGDTVSAK